MANISSGNDSCPNLDWYKNTGWEIGICVHYIFPPFYFILGVSAHILSLVAFSKRAKVEKAFVYQLIESCSKLFLIMTRMIYITTTIWLTGKYGGGVQWWQSCYNCVWFSAKIPTPTMNVFFTTTELLSIFVIYNRISALASPFKYKNTNHNRNQIFAALFSFGVGLLTSMYHYFVYEVVYLDEPGNLYTIKSNNAYENSMIYVIFSQSRNIVRGVSLCTMCTGNVSLVWLYRKHRINSKASRNNSHDKEKEDSERTLTILCLCQSVFMTLSTTTLVTFYAYLAIKPSMYTCEGNLLIPIVNGINELTEICDIYVACLINKKFRKMILSSVPFFNRFLRSNAVANCE